MNKFSLAGLALSLVVAPLSAADTEFSDSIPIDVAEVLFNASLNSGFEIYSDISSEFPDFAVPDDFTVIGSVIDNYNVRAVLGTSLSREQGVQLLVSAFEQESWQQFPQMRPPVPTSGFVTPTPPITQVGISLCHDDLGHLSITSTERDSEVYFAIGRYNTFGNSQSSCANQLAMQQQSISQMRFSNGIRQYMPRMEVPEAEGIRPRGAFLGGGSSSGNNSAETEINLKSELDIEELYTHFADQIVEQDWETDSEAVGGRSATGIWTKSPTADLELAGTLSILEVSEGNYELQFRLRAEGDAGTGSIRVFRGSLN